VIRLLIADDHPIIRLGIRQILEAERDIVIAGEACDGRELLDCAQTIPHDLVVLDVSMPAMDGLDLLKQLRRERPKIPIVVLTMFTDDQLAIRAIKAGAAGYVLKEGAPVELTAAIRKAAAGGRYVTPRVAERLAYHLAGDSDTALHHSLSDREYQVMRMIACGKSTREIGSNLNLSVQTVSTYRARIYEKMRMKSPAELATYVVRNRLAE
jgi:two-component system invasion response regulator UvrY